MTVNIANAQDIDDLVGNRVGESAWQVMSFDRIQAFADATGDHQWIHVDRDRIAKESPFDGPIAHGYFTLSLVAPLFFELVSLPGWKLVINYGCNKVRFPHPVVEDSRIRLALDLTSAQQKGQWWELVFKATIEIEGASKPALVAEIVFRLLAS
jgi:acyl dehydratase